MLEKSVLLYSDLFKIAAKKDEEKIFDKLIKLDHSLLKTSIMKFMINSHIKDLPLKEQTFVRNIPDTTKNFLNQINSFSEDDMKKFINTFRLVLNEIQDHIPTNQKDVLYVVYDLLCSNYHVRFFH